MSDKVCGKPIFPKKGFIPLGHCVLPPHDESIKCQLPRAEEDDAKRQRELFDWLDKPEPLAPDMHQLTEGVSGTARAGYRQGDLYDAWRPSKNIDD